jgi:acyl-CoA synthetase (AMP-forming)/AMP-acid ligase II
MLAVWRRGAVAVLADPLWGGWLRDAVVAHSGGELLVSLPDDGAAASALSPRADRPPLPADCAMLSYTSGTTGDPKGVVLRHRHLLSAYRAAGEAVRGHLGVAPATMGCSMRVSGLGVLGMHYLWPATMGAATVTFPELTLADAGTFWDRQVAHGVDLTYLVPALVALLNYAGKPPTGTGPVPLVLCAGAPLAPDVQERFQATFGAPLLNAYGLTEVSFAAFFGERGADGRATGSIGPPVTVSAQVRLGDGSLLAGPGRGELELTGPSLSDGYYDNPAGTAASFRDDGWLRTGDLAEVDAEGRYAIVGRLKDAVMKGAFTVYLNEVEAAACALDGVVEAGGLRLVLPGGTEDLGLVARVEPDAELTRNAVKAFVADRLGRQRAPRRVVLTTDALPKVGHGKLDRRGLAGLWEAATGEPPAPE